MGDVSPFVPYSRKCTNSTLETRNDTICLKWKRLVIILVLRYKKTARRTRTAGNEGVRGVILNVNTFETGREKGIRIVIFWK